MKEFIKINNLDIEIIHREVMTTAWFDFRRVLLPYNEVHLFLVQKTQLITVDSSYYTANEEGFQRLSIGFARSRIQLVMERVKNALSDL